MRSREIVRRPASWLQQQLRSRGLEISRSSMWIQAELLRRHEVTLVVDVGANRGNYVKDLRRLGYRGRAASFEPGSASYSLLHEAAATDDSWITKNLALGAHAARVELNIAANSGASSSILAMLESHKLAAPEATYIGSETVKQCRLDDIIEDVAIPTDRIFIKLDVQGYEREVLRGGPNTVSKAIGMQIEVSFAPIYETGMLCAEALALLESYGLTLVSITPIFSNPSTRQLLAGDATFLRPEVLRTRGMS